jgi:hypothetical protein
VDQCAVATFIKATLLAQIAEACNGGAVNCEAAVGSLTRKPHGSQYRLLCCSQKQTEVLTPPSSKKPEPGTSAQVITGMRTLTFSNSDFSFYARFFLKMSEILSCMP